MLYLTCITKKGTLPLRIENFKKLIFSIPSETEFTEKEKIGAKRVVKNYMFILISNGIRIAAGFFILIAIVRYLSVEQYGQYSFIISFVTSIFAITYFGIQMILIREIAKNKLKASQNLGVALQLRISLSAIAILILIVSMYYMELPALIVTAGMFAIASEFFLTITMLIKSAFIAYEKMIYDPIITMSYSLVFLMGIIFAIYFDLGFLLIFVFMAVANLIQLVTSLYIFSSKFFRPSLALDKSIYLKFLKDALLVGIGIFFYKNLFLINVLMLKWLGRIEDVSYFHAPHNLIVQAQVVFMALFMAIYPVFSRLMHNDREKIANIYEKIFRFSFVVSFFSGIYLFLFSEEVINILFGSKYVYSKIVLMILSWAMVPLAMDMLLNNILIAMNKQIYSVFYVGTALVLNLLAGLIFIPSYGAIAASCISLFSYTFVFFCGIYFVVKNGMQVNIFTTAAKICVALVITAIAVYLLKLVSVPLAIVFGIIIYFGTILLMRTFTINEIMVLVESVRNVRE